MLFIIKQFRDWFFEQKLTKWSENLFETTFQFGGDYWKGMSGIQHFFERKKEI